MDLLTHYYIVSPNGDMNLGQHLFVWWLHDIKPLPEPMATYNEFGS